MFKIKVHYLYLKRNIFFKFYFNIDILRFSFCFIIKKSVCINELISIYIFLFLRKKKFFLMIPFDLCMCVCISWNIAVVFFTLKSFHVLAVLRIFSYQFVFVFLNVMFWMHVGCYNYKLKSFYLFSPCRHVVYSFFLKKHNRQLRWLIYCWY